MITAVLVSSSWLSMKVLYCNLQETPGRGLESRRRSVEQVVASLVGAQTLSNSNSTFSTSGCLFANTSSAAILFLAVSLFVTVFGSPCYSPYRRSHSSTAVVPLPFRNPDIPPDHPQHQQDPYQPTSQPRPVFQLVIQPRLPSLYCHSSSPISPRTRRVASPGTHLVLTSRLSQEKALGRLVIRASPLRR